MSKKLVLGYGEVSDLVFIGKVNKTEEYFLDGKQDITNDFISVMMQYIGTNSFRKISSSSVNSIVMSSEMTKESLNIAIKRLMKLKEQISE